MNAKQGLRVEITGIVQGVGFRPFVYGLAKRLNLTGWVRNTSAGVDIEVEGEGGELAAFAHALREEAPPLARILSLEASPRPAQGFSGFEIHRSQDIPNAFIPISPDVATCPDCLSELFNPSDRRFGYPFINCTNCGPRFTIIENIPYDRPATTMKSFPLCPNCAAEYADPADRRFHAQPVACPVCGPHAWLEIRQGEQWVVSADRQGAISQAQALLAAGKIVAIKGLGGFHLACDATNAAAVSELRRRKLRVDKPFALMMADLEMAAAFCEVEPGERELLASRQRPIVILPRKAGGGVAAEVAPGQATVGVMLPYTPLHALLFAAGPAGRLPPLVMTSGNLSEEPIASENDEARQRLAALCDALLLHDRPIRTRCDDSVTRLLRIAGPAQETRPLPIVLRRSRGYTPEPILLPWPAPPLLAAGGELKNTFCHTRERLALLSHHIGDLENYETLQSFEDGVAHFERLFRIHPERIAHDLHPNYLSTRYAVERAEREGLPRLGVQHHHAHIAACMADNGLDGARPVIGVAFDGTGYGSDGAIWGGEFLIADYRQFRRAAHLAYTPLPGGDAATRKPWRAALAFLWQAGLDWDADLAPAQAACASDRQALRSMLEHNIQTPLTSSMGRLFDAAAALAGGRQSVNYEAQAAIEFEALADERETGVYPFEVVHDIGGDGQALPRRILPAPCLEALIADWRSGVGAGVMAARFHNGVAQMVSQVAADIRRETGIAEVALSGGVWQNGTLLQKTLPLLWANGFQVYVHRQTPPNDGGLALGQAAIAAAVEATN